jgi:hypothetical protein
MDGHFFLHPESNLWSLASNDNSLLSPDGLWHSFSSPNATISAREQWNSALHSVQQSALAPEQTNGRPSLLIATRTLSRGHCLHYRRTKDKILLTYMYTLEPG